MQSLTVNESQTSMTRRKARRIEVRLGVMQTLVLLGFVTGCMACAFYFGYFSGQSMGFERALKESLASAARLPIADTEIGASVQDEIATEVYAKLNPKAKKNKRAKAEIPELGSIQSTKAAPLDIAPVETESEQVTKVKTAERQDDKQVLANNMIDSEKEESKYDTLGDAIRVLGKKKAAQKDAKNTQAPAAKLGDLISSASKSAEKNIEHKPAKKVMDKVEAPQAIQDESLQAALEKPNVPVQKKAPEPVIKQVAKEPIKVKERAKVEKAEVVQKPQKKVPTAPVTKKVPSGWFAQVAAPNALSDAKSLSRTLRSSGFSAHIETAQVRGQEYYRVLVGPEGSRKHAERLVGQLSRENYLKTRPFIKFVR